MNISHTRTLYPYSVPVPVVGRALDTIIGFDKGAASGVQVLQTGTGYEGRRPFLRPKAPNLPGEMKNFRFDNTLGLISHYGKL